MIAKSTLRRLIDLPGIAELEEKALMQPRYADVDARTAFPEIDACSRGDLSSMRSQPAGRAMSSASSAVMPNRAAEQASISGNAVLASTSA